MMKNNQKIRLVNAIVFSAAYFFAFYQGFLVPYDTSSFAQGGLRGIVVGIPLLFVWIYGGFVFRALQKKHNLKQGLQAGNSFLAALVSVRWWGKK